MGKRAKRMEMDELQLYGGIFGQRPELTDGVEVAVWLAGELLRVRTRDGSLEPLQANAVQLKFQELRRRQNIVVKARQMGMTTWIAGRFFLKTIAQPGVMTVQVAQTREAAEAIFRMVQRFWENLPPHLQTGPLRRSRANVGQMIFPGLDSEFRVLTASDENAGRGLTIHNLHCSEVSRWTGDAAATLAGLQAALVPGGELVLESTPNGAYGCFYQEWQQAPEKQMARHFFPWWLEEAYVAPPAADLRDDERALMAQHGLTLEQIGYRRTLETRYLGLRAQEFAEDPELCFRATGECCFDLETVERALATLPEVVEVRRNGALQVWLPPVPGKEYLVAVDTAGGGADGDFAAVQVIELESGVQCAELRQKLGALELARVAAQLGWEYASSAGRPAQMTVERNNHGAGVLAYLDAVERYPRLYEQHGVPGWLTTASSKPAMVSRMGALLLETPWLFRSRRLLEECRTYITYAGGRTGAANGAHDDCLMAMAIAHAVRAERLPRSSSGAGAATRSRAA